MPDERVAPDSGALLLLEQYVRLEHERAATRALELEEAGRLLASATSRSLGARETGAEALAATATPAVVNRLLTESRGMVRNFVLTVEQGPALDEATVRANRERIERGDPQRAVYPADVLTTSRGQRWLGMWAEAGEDQRVLPTTSTEFAVFGETAVVALGEWDDVEAGYVLLRDPLVVRLYTAYFDLAWRHAVPVPSADGARRRRPAARRAARARGQGRGDRPAPRGQPAHRAAAGGAADVAQRGRQPLPARLGAREHGAAARPR